MCRWGCCSRSTARCVRRRARRAACYGSTAGVLNELAWPLPESLRRRAASTSTRERAALAEPLRSATRTFPKVESRFPMDDSTLHEGESTHMGRLAGASRPTVGRLTNPTWPLSFGELSSPGSTRRNDLPPPGSTRPCATTVCRATASGAPSYIA